jgi:hypothetical protein
LTPSATVKLDFISQQYPSGERSCKFHKGFDEITYNLQWIFREKLMKMFMMKET